MKGQQNTNYLKLEIGVISLSLSFTGGVKFSIEFQLYFIFIYWYITLELRVYIIKILSSPPSNIKHIFVMPQK